MVPRTPHSKQTRNHILALVTFYFVVFWSCPSHCRLYTPAQSPHLLSAQHVQTQQNLFQRQLWRPPWPCIIPCCQNNGIVLVLTHRYKPACSPHTAMPSLAISAPATLSHSANSAIFWYGGSLDDKDWRAHSLKTRPACAAASCQLL